MAWLHPFHSGKKIKQMLFNLMVDWTFVVSPPVQSLQLCGVFCLRPHGPNFQETNRFHVFVVVVLPVPHAGGFNKWFQLSPLTWIPKEQQKTTGDVSIETSTHNAVGFWCILESLIPPNYCNSAHTHRNHPSPCGLIIWSYDEAMKIWNSASKLSTITWHQKLNPQHMCSFHRSSKSWMSPKKAAFLKRRKANILEPHKFCRRQLLILLLFCGAWVPFLICNSSYFGHHKNETTTTQLPCHCPAPACPSKFDPCRVWVHHTSGSSTRSRWLRPESIWATENAILGPPKKHTPRSNCWMILKQWPKIMNLFWWDFTS